MSRYPLPWFDSAPGHQETPKPPSGGFFFYGLAGLASISLGYPPQKPSICKLIAAPNSCASGNPWFKRVELI